MPLNCRKLLSLLCVGMLLLSACGTVGQDSPPADVQAESATAASETTNGSVGDLLTQITADGTVLEAMLESYSHKEFAAGAVDDDDLALILQAGVRAPSARNLQPWHFSAIRNADKVSAIVQQAPEGGVVVVVSGSAEESEGIDVSLDCGLATENIYVAAQALGYAAHIYMGGVAQLNADKAGYGIPEDHNALVAVLISRPAEGADAVTGASERHAFDAVVTYVD